MRKKKIEKEDNDMKEYLLSIGYRSIEVIELIDITFIRNAVEKKTLSMSMNFESTQIEYNG